MLDSRLIKICKTCSKRSKFACLGGSDPVNAFDRIIARQCPLGLFPENDIQQGPAAPVNDRPPGHIARAISFTKAAITGVYVSDEIRAEREATCLACHHVRTNASDNHPECSLCGCSVSEESRKIMNLAAYEERLPEYGCKHPQRAQGQGWKR